MIKTNPFDKKKFPNCWEGHEYALDVVEGRILACKFVIGSCNRYLNDVSNTLHPTFFFKVEKAEKFLRLAQKFEHAIGKWKSSALTYEPWQKFAWMNIMGFIDRRTGERRFRTAHVEIARGNGKLHSLDTKVPTPDGMKLWEEIEVGSRLYDRSGNTCNVVGKTPIHSPQMYEIEFSDGLKLKVSDKHLWYTQSKIERSRESRHNKRPPTYPSAKKVYETVRDTETIAASLEVGGRYGGNIERNHSILNTKPIVGEKKNLPIDPYVFGYWLGNGSTGDGRVTCHEGDVETLLELFKQRGFEKTSECAKKYSRGVTLGFKKLREILIRNGLDDKNVIPEDYFLAPTEDRLELVRGLLDSDGSVNTQSRGQVEFTAKRPEHAKALARLLFSLGYKVWQGEFQVSENNNFKSDTVFSRVAFYPRGLTRVFNFERKYSKQLVSSGKHTYANKRYIVGCKKLKTKHPGFCVEVDSPDSSYLIGEGYIPTHNSPMAAIAGLYFLCLDNPVGNKVSCVATKKDQARIVLDSARSMARKNKSFIKKMKVSVRAHTILHEKSDSEMRALSNEAKTLDGLNDVLASLDELHAMDRATYEVVTSGMSKRTDSLTLCITTAGFDMDSVGYSQSTYAKKVALGEHIDDSFFSIVYTLDETDYDNIYDEKVWIKANPNYGISVDPITFRAKSEKAQITPSDIPNFKVKHLNIWISEMKAYFDLLKWDACADPTLKIEDFLKKGCKTAIDLASMRDLTSTAIIFREDGIYTLFDKTYLPEERAKEVRSVIFDQAAAKGELILTTGKTINNDRIRDDVLDIKDKYRLTECAYDPWNAKEMSMKLAEKRVEMVEYRMNVANLSEPMKKFDKLMRDGKIRHNGSSLFRWCLGNVVAKMDANENVFPRKTHEDFKIDPVVAALMALGLWLQDESKESVYEERGILVV